MSNFDRSRYVVVFFDFSAICKAIETLEQRFEEYCHRHVENAMERNPDLFPLRSSWTTAASKSGDSKSPAGRDAADAKADSLRSAEAMVSRTAVCDASSETTTSNGVRSGGKILRCPFESRGSERSGGYDMRYKRRFSNGRIYPPPRLPGQPARP